MRLLDRLDRGLARIRLPRRPAWSVLLVLGIAALFALADWLTLPPPLPSFAATRAAWRPSEAWLYDRNGVLIDSSRVNFAVRRLAWMPLDQIAPAVPAALIRAEDRRFAHHHGVDWLALAGVVRARLEGRRVRGARNSGEIGGRAHSTRPGPTSRSTSSIDSGWVT